MLTLYKCDKCGGLVDRPLIPVSITRGEKNDEQSWLICDFCENVSHNRLLVLESESQTVQESPEEKAARTDGKRAVRTKSTGDRVYLVDDNAKTKAWITSPEILEKLGFSLNDVEDVEDSMLVGYQMSPSIYKVD